MFELIDQKNLYYYQIPQGEDNEYSRKMIYSEFLHMSDMIKERFGITITEEALREACSRVNAERKSIIDLMQIQKQIPAVAQGIDIYRELEGNRNILDRKERTQANIKSLDKLISNPKTIPASAKRILITGCPLGGIWDKIISIIDDRIAQFGISGNRLNIRELALCPS